MLDKILSHIAPHRCTGCGALGSILCEHCKYDIINHSESYCLICLRPTGSNYLCHDCNKKALFERAWVVSKREDVLKRLIDQFKFERLYEAYKALGDLLLEILPDLPPETVIVPVPANSNSRRQRGYDHMWLVGRYIAKKRDLKYQKVIKRRVNTNQHRANSKQRQIQASRAFYVDSKLPDIPYLIIDDIYTTGATIYYAAKALKSAGAKHIWVAVIARQVRK